MAKSDIFEYVGELEEEIEASRYAKLSKTNKVIDEKIVMEIIGDIKNALHEELDASVKIMAERDQIINAAETQAAEILKKARRDKLAYAKANSLLETSRQNAQTIRKRANQYAEEVFDDLEKYYKESIELIQLNKSRLYKKSEPVITAKEKSEA